MNEVEVEEGVKDSVQSINGEEVEKTGLPGLIDPVENLNGNGNGSRTHHFNLAKKISEMNMEIENLKSKVYFIRSLFPVSVWNGAVKKYNEYQRQIDKTEREHDILQKKKSKLYKLDL